MKSRHPTASHASQEISSTNLKTSLLFSHISKHSQTISLIKIETISGPLSMGHLSISQDIPRISVKLRNKSSSTRGCPAEYWQISSRHPMISFSAREDIPPVKNLQMSHRYPGIPDRYLKDMERSPKDAIFTTRHLKKITLTYFLLMWPQMPLRCLNPSDILHQAS